MMPVFELNEKKVSYGLDQEDGKVLIEAEEVAVALGYSPEVIDDIGHGAASDVIAEIDAVVDRQFGPPESNIEQYELNGYAVRFSGKPPEGKVCLTDFIRAIGGKPIDGSNVWVGYLEWRDWMLTRLDRIRSEYTALDGVLVRCIHDPFLTGETVYSANDIIEAITQDPLGFDEGWLSKEQAMRLIKMALHGWQTFVTTGQLPEVK